ncbi:hypothetical protein [Magnetospirillum fulvum]|uniref:GDSL-like Lipase/Acylhydrolase n=1 Tax=Magnetospirillum fulvum TaxID=1082 RepID=A0A1H6JKM0_MAGFU|nr:hypothetical protein [Magnetospirillum fulvum]SEH62561.1 GDSL-like Lipase/Acylhydrolase [Magnetospirillum fulvum]
MSNLELMAIGDSLYQGVRSMTIKTDLCRTSTPAQVAAALGETEFASPDPGNPMIIDPERWLKDPHKLGRELAEYAAYWQKEPGSPHGLACFDNVSVAGSEVWHLYDFTATQGQAQAREEFAKLGGAPLSLSTIGKVDLSRMIYGINSRFVLNPGNLPDHAEKTQIGWVAERKPRRLLVNIGSNNGLWDMCLKGDPKAGLYFGKPGGSDPDDYSQIEALAEALDSLPPEVETIYFNSLGRPRCVANLMPNPDNVEWATHPGEAYFESYENRFALSPAYNLLSAEQMSALDQRVAQANARIAEILTKGITRHRLAFVDFFGLLTDKDAKHWGDSRATWAANHRISNNTFQSGLLGGFAHGGLFGLDGMHPTTVGYGIVAQRVLDVIAQTETSPSQAAKVDLDALCREDWLIQHCSAKWTPLLFGWRDYRRLHAGRAALEPFAEENHAIIDLMAAARFGG